MSSIFLLAWADLTRPIADLFAQARAAQGGEGLPRFSYCDGYDSFSLRVTRGAGLGLAPWYEVGCFLNGAPSYQLNGQRFAGGDPIGRAMLIAAAAPAGVQIEEFFS